jgi:hypothetical protein
MAVAVAVAVDNNMGDNDMGNNNLCVNGLQ